MQGSLASSQLDTARRTGVLVAAALAALGLTSGPALAVDSSAPAILQWFESTYNTQERRTADLFAAGYGAVWTPPPFRADSGNLSVGYDVYNRFDLGRARAPTLYGTELGLKSLAGTWDRASVDLNIDFIVNHVGFRNSGTAGFVAQGDYPGFVVTLSGAVDGDFHTAFPPSGPEYEYQYRLSGLIDIDHRTNHQFVRNPVPGFANNIPAGTIADIPNEDNRRFYPDRNGTPIMVYDPMTGETNIPIYSYNTADPMAGDPIADNAMGYLMRNAQWLVQEVGVDGFRVDAARHVYPWVHNYMDRAVYRANPRLLLDGSQKQVFSYLEAYTGDKGHLQNHIRKDYNPADPGKVSGNRDVLDFPLFFAMRDNLTGNGTVNNWHRIRHASQDSNDDGNANNGTQGVSFVISHDDGGAYLTNVAHAFTLMRPGNTVVYFNAKEHGNGRPFPKDGRGDALGGYHGETIKTLVNLRNTHGRGNFAERWVDDAFNPNGFSNIYVYERQNSAVVGLNSRLDNGFDTRNGVQTAFAPGTLLLELTGNATNGTVDPFGDIADVLVVDGTGKINIKIPRNKNANGVEHGLGYVIYGPSGPQGSMTLSGVDHTIAGEVPTEATNDTARLSAIDVVKGNSFTVNLSTTAVSLMNLPQYRDRDADGDNALLKLDGGLDVNGSGGVDYVTPGTFKYGFEEFVTLRQPGYDQASGNGQYQQTINTTQLAEGYHFLEARALRRRAAGAPEIYTPFKRTIYVDRLAPISAVDSFNPIGGAAANRDVVVKSVDQTASEVHVLLNVPAARTDAEVLAMISNATKSGQIDRDLFAYGVLGLKHGNQAITVVTKEITGTTRVQRFGGYFTQTSNGQGFGDTNFDGTTNADDIGRFDTVLQSNNTQYNPAAELDGDGLINLADTFLLGPRLTAINATPATVTRYNELVQSPFVKAGTYNVNANHDVYEVTAAVTNVNAGASLTATHVRGTTLNVNDGAVARIRANGTDAAVSRLTNVNIAGSGQLDLTDNDLIVDYESAGANPYEMLRAYIGNGRITSSTAGGDKVLAVVDNAIWGETSFGGQTIDGSTIVGKYTYFGDANLDGRVTSDDYVAVDVGLGLGTTWLQGDFNFSGSVTSDDYVAIDVNLGKGTPTPAAFAELKAEMIALHTEMFGAEYVQKLAAAEANGFAVVPEPGGLLLGGALCGLLLRRRPRVQMLDSHDSFYEVAHVS